MAIINLNSGYVGSPEKQRIFLKKFATSQEIHDKYHEKLDYQRRNNKPLRTDRSLDNFLKDFDALGMISKKEFPSVSFRDFKNSGIFDLFKYVDYISYDIDDVIDPIGLLYSKYENKNFFDNLIYDDIPDDLYYSYGTWKESVYDYNGSSNPNYMASNFNMMMGELGFGFQKRKKQAYKNAIVVGVCI